MQNSFLIMKKYEISELLEQGVFGHLHKAKDLKEEKQKMYKFL